MAHDRYEVMPAYIEVYSIRCKVQLRAFRHVWQWHIGYPVHKIGYSTAFGEIIWAILFRI